MRFSEFTRMIKSWNFKQYGELLVNLDELEIYHPDNDKRMNLVKDPRSYKVGELWQVYPIATSRNQVHIVCPYCGKIHSHGNGGEYGGFRVPHCYTDKPNYNILQK